MPKAVRPKSVQQLVRQGAFCLGDEPRAGKFKTLGIGPPRAATPKLQKQTAYRSILQKDIIIHEMQDKLKRMKVSLRKQHNRIGLAHEEGAIFKKFRGLLRRNEDLEAQLKQKDQRLHNMRCSIKFTNSVQNQIKEEEYQKQIYRLRAMVKHAQSMKQQLGSEVSPEEAVGAKVLKSRVVKRLKSQNLNVCSLLSLATLKVEQLEKEVADRDKQIARQGRQISQLRQSLKSVSLQPQQPVVNNEESVEVSHVHDQMAEQIKELNAQIDRLTSAQIQKSKKVKELTAKLKDVQIHYQSKLAALSQHVVEAEAEVEHLKRASQKEQKQVAVEQHKHTNGRLKRVLASDVSPICFKVRMQMLINDFGVKTLRLAIPKQPSISQLSRLLCYPPFLIEKQEDALLLARYLIEDNRLQKVQFNLEARSDREVICCTLAKAICPYAPLPNKKMHFKSLVNFFLHFSDFISNCNDAEMTFQGFRQAVAQLKDVSLCQQDFQLLQAFASYHLDMHDRFSPPKVFRALRDFNPDN